MFLILTFCATLKIVPTFQKNVFKTPTFLLRYYKWYLTSILYPVTKWNGDVAIFFYFLNGLSLYKWVK